MHSAFGKTIAYTGWTILGFIVLVVIIGIMRFHGDIGGYISFLNTRDRTSMASVSQTFWGADKQQDIQIPLDLSGTVVSGDIAQETGTMTGIDAYDPSLESDMDASSASGFGFTAPQDQQTSQEQAGQAQPQNDKQQLMNLIKNRELQTQQTK